MLRSLAIALLLCSCTDRALDSEGGFTLTPVDLAGADLRGVDLAGIKPGVDLATPSVDLAMTSVLGVPCGGDTCKPNEICCPFSGMMGVSCQPVGGGPGGGCFGGEGYRCDGPEDCDMGRHCIGQDQPDPGLAPLQTRCRMNIMGGVLVCHVDGDCPMAEKCTPTMQVVSGAPMLSICQ